MKNTLKGLQTRTHRKHYKFEDLCPYPFDHRITITPFPLGFETPKFDKYKGCCEYVPNQCCHWCQLCSCFDALHCLI